MATRKNAVVERKYPDSIMTDSGRMVRLTSLGPDDSIRVHGRKVYGRDIPLTVYTLDCGHSGKGVAVAVRDVVFCDECSKTSFVAKARG